MVMTLEADYAVRIVEYLTKHPGRWDARTISEEMDVPQRFCLVSLARPAGEITLRQVIESVEGEYMLSRCQKEEYSCGRSHCRLHRIYEKISQDVRRELDSYTFEMICEEGPCACPGQGEKGCGA